MIDRMRSLMPSKPETWHHRFHSLMPYRVREVLLVSSAYDAFVLEEDGPLSERVFTGYANLNLSSAPRITRVSTARDALNLLDRRPFQLVITLVRLEDSDAKTLTRAIKERHPEMPVVLLTFDESDLAQFPGRAPPPGIDRVFLWSGDARILIAAIKLIEDRLNVSHDIDAADVQVILVVDDQLRDWSNFLALLYPELLLQSQSLIGEGLNDQHKMMRMYARPKIILANSFEEAAGYLSRWRDNIAGVVSDMSFPRGGVEDPEAGLALARTIRADNIDLPILLTSSDTNIQERTREFTDWFVDKNAPDFPKRARRFLKIALGFGDFFFRLPNGTEVGRARNAYEMEEALRRVPIESIVYHANRNDFSVWLKARSFFGLAKQLRPREISDFATPEAMRIYLVAVLEKARFAEQEGVITDFSSQRRDMENRFIRLGKGSIGGKGRSIAFIASLVARQGLIERFPDLEIRIPKTLVIGTDEFDRFMELLEVMDNPPQRDDARRKRMLDIDFSPELLEDLRAAFDRLKGPLAVRSSSLLEDSRFLPFAGVYATYMLPNNHPNPDVRFQQLSDAIRMVYASMFSEGARNYTAGTPHSMGDEKMAVVIQQVVGQPFGTRYYPHISGVAQSFNFYPFGNQRAEDGVAVIALGLGHFVVSGGAGLRFSPGAPEVLPQFPDTQSLLAHTQTQFYAIDLSDPTCGARTEEQSCLRLFDLSDAERDGTLGLAGSVYSAQDDVVRENLTLPGPRVVTFNNVLKWNAVPLADALAALLRSLREGLGGEVEIELAVDMGDWGHSPRPGRKPRLPRLYVLQARPMTRLVQEPLLVDFESLPRERMLCRTRRSLGHGRLTDIRDVVYVAAEDVGSRTTPQIARELSQINTWLRDRARPYVLIGPGRWGTADHSLGIPVGWMDIAGAKVIVETPLLHDHVEPSQGSHFFHNVVSLRIGYLAVSPQTDGVFDRAWLDALPARTETTHVRHIELDSPLTVHMDGRRGWAAILKPGRDPSVLGG